MIIFVIIVIDFVIVQTLAVTVERYIAVCRPHQHLGLVTVTLLTIIIIVTVNIITIIIAISFCVSLCNDLLTYMAEAYPVHCSGCCDKSCSFIQAMSSTKRLLVYTVPVTMISFALNIPKFFEVRQNKW